ncbi:MAG: hypothetical protein HONBIEJF_02207 [Fimbriimonadaceae bacterium]|nr:hypothetical protein [Fimbriimonadaceae bacterium]
MNPSLPRTFWPGVILTGVVALYSLAFRHRIEVSNRAVAPLLELAVVQDIAAVSGVEITDALRRLQTAGLGGVVLPETTVRDQVAAGAMRLEGDPEKVAVVLTHPSPRMFAAITHRYRSAVVIDENRIEIPGVGTDGVLSTPLGLPEESCEAIKRSGLLIVARHSNPLGAGPDYARQTLEDSKACGTSTFLPMGEQVLGQRTGIDGLAETLHQLDMTYATPEFAKIAGDAKAVKLLQDRVIRLHSVQAAEVDKMTPEDVIDRFVKAYRERSIRYLLIRPVSAAAIDPIAEMADLLNRIRRGIEKEGGEIKPPHPFQDSGVPRFVFPILGVAVALAAVSILWPLFGAMTPWAPLLAVMGLGAWSESLRPLFAVLAAIVFPIGAYYWLSSRTRVNVFVSVVAMSAISLVGGLAVAGFLNGLPYFVKVSQFPAVKLAHFFPIVVIGYLLLRRHFDIRAFAKSPVAWGGLGIGLLALAVIGIMLMRTGNESPAGVSSLELKIRSVLEQFLYARPRTKEFLFGHPALVVGLGLYARGLAENQRGWLAAAIGLLTLSAIGQTSIVNTLCHLHTPLDLSLARIATGLVLGGMLGGIAWLILNKLLPRGTRT